MKSTRELYDLFENKIFELTEQEKQILWNDLKRLDLVALPSKSRYAKTPQTYHDYPGLFNSLPNNLLNVLYLYRKKNVTIPQKSTDIIEQYISILDDLPNRIEKR